MKIGKIRIGLDEEPLAAEISGNHNNSIKLLFQS